MKRQTFERFCATYDFSLTPAQRVLTAVCFDGAEPSELEPDDRTIAAELFGVVDVVPSIAREVCVWIKGARIGGSRMAATRAYQLGLTLPLEVAPGEAAFALFCGPDMRLARQAFAYALGLARVDEAAGRIGVVRDSTTSITIARHDGRHITLECLPATEGGRAVRGRSLVAAVMTESAFFRDAEHVVNDAEMFRALGPRIVTGGHLILESTPWSQDGLTWDLYSQNFAHPSTALVAHCPTRLMRPDARTLAIVMREEARDPDNAEREFGAAFMATGGNAFFDPMTVDAAMGAA